MPITIEQLTEERRRAAARIAELASKGDEITLADLAEIMEALACVGTYAYAKDLDQYPEDQHEFLRLFAQKVASLTVAATSLNEGHTLHDVVVVTRALFLRAWAGIPDPRTTVPDALVGSVVN